MVSVANYMSGSNSSFFSSGSITGSIIGKGSSICQSSGSNSSFFSFGSRTGSIIGKGSSICQSSDYIDAYLSAILTRSAPKQNDLKLPLTPSL